MTKKYKILGKFIKDMSSETKDVETYIFVRDQISKYKLDIGKSCIRFKKLNEIPFSLIGELCSKMSVKEWITIYEKEINP